MREPPEQAELVYGWPGPPRVELWAHEVRGEGRRWRQHRLVLQGGRAGAVAVVRHDDALLLVEQWRPVVGRRCWELPRGFGEQDDASPAQTATREVTEETGLVPARATVVGSLWPDTGIQANAVVVVEVQVSSRVPRTGTDGEVDELDWVGVGTLDAHIREGRIADGISLAALALWRAHQ